MSPGPEASKPLVDAYAERMGSIVPSADPSAVRVAIDLRLWPELEWLEDGGLEEAVVAAAGPDAYVESEEEGADYVLYCSGLDPAGLGALLGLVLGDAYLVSTEAVPPPIPEGTQVRVRRRDDRTLPSTAASPGRAST